jgi:hypothetical protein
MRHGSLKLRFENDGDGTGKLSATAEADGYSGQGSAYFNITAIEDFSAKIARFPLPEKDECSLSGGFASSNGTPAQEHLGIDVYPIDKFGHIGIQIRTTTPAWKDSRANSQKMAQLEIVTSYEPIARFSRDLLALIAGRLPEAVLEGESFPQLR